MYKRLSATVTLCFLTSLLPVSAGAAGAASGFLPHRAVYDLELKEASDRSGIRGMYGRIVYELTGSACDGFSSRYRFNTRVQIGGRTLDNDQRSSTYESPDGSRFNFVTQYYLNGQKEQDLRGSATRDASGVSVSLKKPDERNVSLEPAIFMNQHLVKIIEAARAGDAVLTARIYDGTDDGDRLVDTTTIIGKEKPGANSRDGEPEKLSSKFEGKAAWPVSVSYFKTGKVEGGGERTPSYVVSFLLQEDGVSRDLTMRYDDYAMKGTLKQIEYLEISACD